MPPAQAWRTLRYSSTLKILAPSLLSQKGKGWTTFTPPAAAPCRRFRGLVSHRRSDMMGADALPPSVRQLVALDRPLALTGPLENVERLGNIGVGGTLLEIVLHAQGRQLF